LNKLLVHILIKNLGCPACAKLTKGWTRTTFKEKCAKNNNSSGILYVVKCWNDDKSEIFIKIGITSNSIKTRYNSKTSMPYSYEVLNEIVGPPKDIFDLEIKLHNKYKKFKYQPTTQFGGSIHECLKHDLECLVDINEEILNLKLQWSSCQSNSMG
jgi:hypothetical protein